MSPSPVIYVAHPIDFADLGRGRLEIVCSTMATANLTPYVPGWAFRTPSGASPNEALNRINRAALTEADGLLAFLPPPGRVSYGVPMEIEMAREQGKPTLVIGDSEIWTQSWALPRTENVVYSDEITRANLNDLAARVFRQRRQRERPVPSRAMYVKTEPGAALPTRAYEGDAGFDLYTLEDTEIAPGAFVDVPVGLSVQLPDGVWGMITGRSSTARKSDLLVTMGIIDTGYRGPLFAGVRSLRDEPYTVLKGDRIAQLIPFPNLAQQIHPVAVDMLTPTDRGELGFGSSGI